jgi:hypothetical protein
MHRFIPVRVHAMVEPLIAILLIAGPWIFGFSDADDATIVSIAAGVVVLVVGQTTRWRLSLLKIIPLRTHAYMDMMLGVVLIVLPFLLGYSDQTGALILHLVLGVGEIGAALMTDWRTEDEVRAH